MRRAKNWRLVAVVFGCVVVTGAVTAEEEERAKAIQAGIAYLSQAQQTEGYWKGASSNYEDGITALCTLALLRGDMAEDDPHLQRALAWLRDRRPDLTYSLALQTLVFAASNAEGDRAALQRNVDWLVNAQAADGAGQGGWSYAASAAGRGDGSCTRFAIWALDAARRAGVKAPDSVWRANADYWLNSQRADGGWGYMPGPAPSTATMTLSGIYCLSAIRQAIADQALAERIEQAQAAAWRAHDQGSPDGKPKYLQASGFRYYAFHTLALAATRTEHERILEVAWQPPATLLLLSQQTATGAWNGETGGFAPELVGTSLALLFLTEK